MKKTLLIALSALLTASAFGQKLTIAPEKGTYGSPLQQNGSVSARTASVVTIDSLVMLDVTPTDTATNYYISQTGAARDSGYLAGENFAGWSGYAQRYDFNGTDSQVSVIGVITLFTGNLKSTVATSQTVNLKVWNPAAAVAVRPTLSFSGFPGTEIDSIIGINIANIGVGINDTAPDTFKVWYFNMPTAYLSNSFFVGYTMNYSFGALLGGDTIALETTRIGERTTAEYTVTSGDTIINDQVAFQDTFAGTTQWGDAWANFGYNLNLIIYPVIDAQGNTTLSVHGVTNQNLTFFGTYPNPAVNSTNVRFSLGNSSDVMINITDMNGRTINTINQENLAAGEHIVSLQTTDLPSGNYLILLHSSAGGGIASKLTIIK